MQTLIYLSGRLFLGFMHLLPLPFVAWLGRRVGTVVYWLDGRHRAVALENLRRCYGNVKSAAEIRALARENFVRIGENFACATKTATMSAAEIGKVLEFSGSEKLRPAAPGEPTPIRVVAIGHFGNFELYARATQFAPEGGRRMATYRGLNQPGLERLLRYLRDKSGCEFHDRRAAGDVLRAALNQGGLTLGLLADQYPGKGGVKVRFFGQDCFASAAPAVLALRYNAALFTAFCYRTAPARWRIEVGDEIPTHADGRPRSADDITRDINAAYEAAIRRDPANWFWVHNRWKVPRRWRRKSKHHAEADES